MCRLVAMGGVIFRVLYGNSSAMNCTHVKGEQILRFFHSARSLDPSALFHVHFTEAHSLQPQEHCSNYLSLKLVAPRALFQVMSP